MKQDIEQCVLQLHRIGAIKFGEFKLKSGVLSPIYIDLRLVISYPTLLQEIAALMWKRASHNLSSLAPSFDLICGVPYTALPIATALSLKHHIPMVMRRKEAKEYGTKKMIEGAFAQGQNCLVIEDLITSGSSVFETIAPLEAEGMKVTDVVVLLDREQGGKQRIEERGYRLHAVLTMNDLLESLEKMQKISSDLVHKVKEFIGTPLC